MLFRSALFLLIAVGRAARPEIRRLNISARQVEELFHWLYDLTKSAPFDVTPREGYHFRRVLLQRKAKELGISVGQLLADVERNALRPTDISSSGKAAKIMRAPLGVNDGKGVVFISYQGDVQPSGFLNLVGGNVRRESLVNIYRISPTFLGIRDYAQIEGKCGVCEFKFLCGGSRSRAYAITGNPMQSDPYCVYQPAPWSARRRPAKPTAEETARQGGA